MTQSVRNLKPVVCAINVTDGAGAKVRMSSLAAAIHIKQLGADPVLQMTCRDRNRIALQSDLLGAAAFGIANVLALGGDGIAAGDDPEAKAVFDLDARTLLAAMHCMTQKGATLAGVELSSKTAFFPGAVDAPVTPEADWSPQSLLAKSAAGARFVQTQFCFDMDVLARYADRLRQHGLTEKMYFLVGLGPLRSADGARWMQRNLHGTIIPDGIIRRLEAARDPRHEGIAICAELIQQAREIDGIAGVHLMAPGQHLAIVEAVKLAGLV